LCTMDLEPSGTVFERLRDRRGGRGVAMAMMIRGSVLVLTAAMVAPAHAQVDPGARVCGAIVVSSPDRPRVRDGFSARKTLDLQFRMRLSNSDEEAHVVSFRIYTPTAHLYQEIQVAHRADARKGRRVASISAGLPVAGTAIATSSLYGRWRVVPYIDDSPRPCAAAAVFSIVK
jgi:hypothetical protein